MKTVLLLAAFAAACFGQGHIIPICDQQATPNCVNVTVPAVLPANATIVLPAALVSVKDFGALGDGATDDTAAWQAALNAGVPLWCPQGTYIVQSLAAANSDTQVYGAGMGNCILQAKTSGVGQVLSFAFGSGHNQLVNLTVNANGANYGIFCAASACWQNKYEDVEVYGATGTPGTGIFNTSNCYGQEFRGMRITENNIGASFTGTCQGTTLAQSKIYSNNTVNLIVGDGSAPLDGFSITDSDIECGTTTTTLYDIEVQNVLPLVIHGTYFESCSTSSADLYFVGSSYDIVHLDGIYSNGNSAATHAILVNSADVHLTMSDSYYFNGLGSTFDSETANGSVTLFVNSFKSYIGCTPVVPDCSSPAEYDLTGPGAQFTTAMRSPWLNTIDQHSGNVLTMNSTGSPIGTLSLGTSGAGSWCLGYAASNTQTLGTCVLNWDGNGEFWASPDTAFPSNPYTRTAPGFLWDNANHMYLSAQGSIYNYFGDTNRGTNGKWWSRRLIDSTGDLQELSNNDDGSALEVAIDMGRNSGLGLAGATACTNFNDCGQVVVQGGLQLSTTAPAPTCASGTRGEIYVAQGSPDTVEVCTYSGSSYAWLVLTAAPGAYTGTAPVVVSGSAISCPSCLDTAYTATAPVAVTASVVSCAACVYSAYSFRSGSLTSGTSGSFPTTPASGTYQVSAYLAQTVATAGCGTAPSATITVSFTDGNGHSWTIPASSLGLGASLNINNAAPVTIDLNGSSTPTWSVNWSSGLGCSATGAYEFDINLRLIG